MIGENELVVIGVEELTDFLQNLAASPWLTLEEAATYLRCSKRKIEQLIASRQLPFSRQDPSHQRSPKLIHRKHLIAFLISGKNAITQRLTPVERRLVDELL